MNIDLGLIGCGKWGERYINAACHTRQCNIVKVCTRNNRETIPWWVSQTNDPDKLINNSIHGVIIATPPDSHFKLAQKCLDKKIPFLLEKPMSLNRVECRELTAMARHLNQPFQMNHIHLYSDAYLRLREIVSVWRSSRMCDLTIMSRGGNNGPFRDYDSFSDYAPHDISMILGLLNDFEWTDVRREVSRMETEVGDSYKMSLSGPNFRSTSWVGNSFIKKYRTFDVFNESTGDHISYSDNYPEFKLELNGISIPTKQTPPLVNSVNAFCDLVRGQTDWRNNFNFYDSIYDLMHRSDP